MGKLSGAWITVKSPPVSGQRYELDQQLDSAVAVSILQRSQRVVIKNRHSIWLGEDGWEIDEFGGQNHGLILAECERTGPVVDLEVPRFCETEVSSDLRFTNDNLSKHPWMGRLGLASSLLSWRPRDLSSKTLSRKPFKDFFRYPVRKRQLPTRTEAPPCSGSVS